MMGDPVGQCRCGFQTWHATMIDKLCPACCRSRFRWIGPDRSEEIYSELKSTRLAILPDNGITFTPIDWPTFTMPGHDRSRLARGGVIRKGAIRLDGPESLLPPPSEKRCS